MCIKMKWAASVFPIENSAIWFPSRALQSRTCWRYSILTMPRTFTVWSWWWLWTSSSYCYWWWNKLMMIFAHESERKDQRSRAYSRRKIGVCLWFQKNIFGYYFNTFDEPTGMQRHAVALDLSKVWRILMGSQIIPLTMSSSPGPNKSLL